MTTVNKAATVQHGTEFTTPSDTEVVATRVFDAPRQLVWDAFTKPEHIRQWMLGPDGWTMPICEMDLRPGGRWRWGWAKEDGSEPFEMSGEYREVDPPNRLVNTERWGEEWAEALTTTEFFDEGGRTRVVCTASYPSKEARDAAMQTGMTDGWGQSYDRLAKLLPSLG